MALFSDLLACFGHSLFNFMLCFYILILKDPRGCYSLLNVVQCESQKRRLLTKLFGPMRILPMQIVNIMGGCSELVSPKGCPYLWSIVDLKEAHRKTPACLQIYGNRSRSRA